MSVIRRAQQHSMLNICHNKHAITHFHSEPSELNLPEISFMASDTFSSKTTNVVSIFVLKDVRCEKSVTHMGPISTWIEAANIEPAT